jgi:hypothetical protein
MQAAIDRVLQTYGLMVNLTAEEEQATRRRLEKHLAGMQADDNALAVEGLRYLRGPDRIARRRMAREAAWRIVWPRGISLTAAKSIWAEDYEVHYWTKHLNISKEELQKAVEKVGNSAAAVRKELAVGWRRGVCSRSLERGPHAFQ